MSTAGPGEAEHRHPLRGGPPLSSLVWLVVAGKLALHLACAGGYGYFRDELYYLACARHLAWGYVDHPPLSVALLALVRSTLGESRLALRLVPALAGAALVYGAAHLARRMGGGRFAQLLAALAVLASPMYLGLDHFYSMNALELVAWLAITCLAVPLLLDPAADTAARWVLLGVAIGLGLLNKASVLWLVGGLFVGLCATPSRRLLARPGPWLALALAGLLVAPHLHWQATHGWPTREFVANATAHKMVRVSPLEFLAGQVTNLGPHLALLWIPGLLALLWWPPLSSLRALGIAWLAMAALLIGNGTSRAGYLAPSYPPLLAAGAVWLSAWASSSVIAEGRPFGWMRARAPLLVGALLAALGALTAPLGLPCLPVEQYRRYAAWLGLAPDTEEKKEVGPLPQFYADMFGWPELADTVARATAALTDDERGRAVVIAGNYGEAAALEQFGAARLPPVASAHNNYWLWGPRNPRPDIIVRLSNDADALAWLGTLYGQCQAGARFDHPLVMPYENHMVVYVCRQPHQPLGERWAAMKHFN